MGKVKIKRKSTLIDMTAMSDVTVLLLTFFMLTSTFLQKEPTTVHTPSSVSEEEVPTKNLVTILVSAADQGIDDPTKTEGKIFISFAGDSIIASDSLRYRILDKAVAIYNTQGRGIKEPLKLTSNEYKAFMTTNMMGTPFRHLKEVLDMEMLERDKLMSDLRTEDPNRAKLIGIPINNNTNENTLNDFQVWMQAIKSVAQDARAKKLETENLDPSNPDNVEAIRALDMLYNSLMQGKSISIKADRDTPFSVINQIFENLRFMELNKFTLVVAHKQDDSQPK